MLKLSKKIGYGLMAVKLIAQSSDGELLSAKAIAAKTGIPYDILAKILHRLVRSGLITSQQGAHGGYCLARPVQDIKISTIAEAVDGPLQLVTCSGPNSDGSDQCDLLENCSVRTPLCHMEIKLRKVFEDTTVSDII